MEITPNGFRTVLLMASKRTWNHEIPEVDARLRIAINWLKTFSTLISSEAILICDVLEKKENASFKKEFENNDLLTVAFAIRDAIFSR